MRRRCRSWHRIVVYRPELGCLPGPRQIQRKDSVTNGASLRSWIADSGATPWRQHCLADGASEDLTPARVSEIRGSYHTKATLARKGKLILVSADEKVGAELLKNSDVQHVSRPAVAALIWVKRGLVRAHQMQQRTPDRERN